MALPHLVLVCLEKVGLVLESKLAGVLGDAVLDLFRKLDSIGSQGLQVRVHVVHCVSSQFSWSDCRWGSCSCVSLRYYGVRDKEGEGKEEKEKKDREDKRRRRGAMKREEE